MAEFYAKYPPFDKLPSQALQQLAENTRVSFVARNEIIFEENTTAVDHFYFVHKGHIRLESRREDNRLYDIADEGDTFGIAPLMRDELYALTAVAQEESLLFEIPWSFFQTILKDHGRVALHFAAGFAAGYHKDIAQARVAQASGAISADNLFQEDDIIEINPDKKPITATKQDSIRKVAGIMTQKNIGSMIIADSNELPLGILTDTDLRKKVATGEIGVDEPVEKIMTSPVYTVKKNLTVAQAIMVIMRKNIRHLVVTEDGTADTKVISIISEHDLLLLHSNNPIVLIKEISQTNDVEVLKKIRQRAEQILNQYLNQNVSMVFLSEIISELNDAIIEKCIKMAIAKVKPEINDTAFTWLSLGSEGRSEQLLLTDQDNAIIFEDCEDETANKKVKEELSRLGKKVNDLLNTVGFEYCPADIMAGKWCLSVSQWQKTFSGYMQSPDPQAVMHSTIFFDFRVVYGDNKLAEKLTDHISTTLTKERGFLTFMAANALQNPPPLSFFKNFVVEKGGEHSNEFDIKARALMPLTDAARVLALEHRCFKNSNTRDRYSCVAQSDTSITKLLEEAKYAHELLLRYRTMSGLRNNDSGRYIKIDELGKIERQTLRSVFSVIERVQKMLSLRFQLERMRL